MSAVFGAEGVGMRVGGVSGDSAILGAVATTMKIGGGGSDNADRLWSWR